MVDGTKVASGAPQSSSGAETEVEQVVDDGNESRRDSVAYDTYKKVLSEKKKFQDEYNKTKSKLDSVSEKVMATEGRKDELLESYKKQALDNDAKLKKAVGTFAFKSLVGAVEREALKLGCSNIDDLIKLSANDLGEIEVDDDFNVNADQVKELVDRQRRARPFLFTKNVKDAKVGVGIVPQNVQPDWTKLSISEQAKLIFKK